MIRAVAAGMLIVVVMAGCSRTTRPPVTAEGDRIRVRSTGSVYVRLTLTNSSDASLWARSCVVRLGKPLGAQVLGVLDVRSMTLVPPGETEPLQGTNTQAGAPVTVGRHQNLVSLGPGACVSGPDKASMMALPRAAADGE